MCAVHSQPVKGRVDLLLTFIAFIVSSALCHLSVLLAFRTDHIQVKQNSRTHENNTWWLNQKRQMNIICLIQMDSKIKCSFKEIDGGATASCS